MRKVTEILPTQGHRPMELRHLRVAAYCRVSTELEEQTSSIELQERHYSQLISANPNWESAGIFAERATGLNTKERPEFRRMIAQCRKKRIDLILTKSISRFGRNTLDMLRSLRDLRGLGVEVYFEQEDMWLNEQRIQILLTAYCALAQAESEDMSRNINGESREALRRAPRATLNLCVLGISVEMMEGWLLMSLTLRLFGRCLR